MKTKSFSTIALFILLTINMLLILLTSCDDPEIEHYIDEETKSYCYFENGAYYIYQDSISGTIDSIKISSNWQRPIYAEDECEAYETDITDWNGQIIGKYLIEISMLSDFPSSANLSFSNSIIITQTIYNSRDMGIEENPGSSIGVLCDIYSHYQIENNDFYDIKKFKTQSNSNCYYSYWAKNVGLIRYEAYDLNDSLFKTINLVEYEINN
jgi:hypothetical protein